MIQEEGKINTVLDVVLSWSAGVGAVSHLVYLDADMANVEARSNGLVNGASTADPSYSPGPLDPDTTYYWAIDEVGADNTTYAGEVWSFTTVPDIQMTDDPNLIGWWKFDEGTGSTALDWSGRGNHGAIQGNPAWVAGTDGDALALDFDGVGDYVDCGTAAIFDVTDQITVAAWVRVDVFEQTDQAIVSKGQNVWRLVRNGLMSDQLRFDCGGQAIGSTNVNDGEWHHALGMSDGSTVSLFVDGVLDGSAGGTGSIPVDPNLTLWIADTNRPGAGPQAWNGPIDEVRIYDKALTQDEIQGLLRVNPLLAWNASPQNGATPGPGEVTALSWMPGDDAVEHDVFFGMDSSAVEDANASDTTGIYQGRQSVTTFVPTEALQVGNTYYWRLDQVKADGTTAQGSVWSFEVVDFILVDDFDSHGSVSPILPFQTWLDGLGYAADQFFPEEYLGNGTLTAVGHDIWFPGTTFTNVMETGIVLDGSSQSMPVYYDNSEGASETQSVFSEARNWTVEGLSTLVVNVYGDPNNSAESLYVTLVDQSGARATETHVDGI